MIKMEEYKPLTMFDKTQDWSSLHLAHKIVFWMLQLEKTQLPEHRLSRFMAKKVCEHFRIYCWDDTLGAYLATNDSSWYEEDLEPELKELNYLTKDAIENFFPPINDRWAYGWLGEVGPFRYPEFRAEIMKGMREVTKIEN
ncbi:hypothetical protein ACFL35_17405 [Candidatus Riflebacteria bacterium]